MQTDFGTLNTGHYQSTNKLVVQESMKIDKLYVYIYYGLSKELPVEELPRTTLHNPPRSKKQSGNQRKIEGNLFPNHCFFPLQLHGCSMIPGPPDPPPHIRNHANLYKDIDFNDSEVTAPPTTLPTPCKFVEVCCFSTIMVPFFLGRRILLSKSIVLLSKKMVLLSKSTFLRGESMVLLSKSIVLLTIVFFHYNCMDVQ